MHRRMMKIVSSIKEKSCVSFAKIATIGGYCDIDHIITKATSPDDLPLNENYIQELMKIFSISPSSYKAFSLSFTQRFRKTQSWKVALKCLLLLHRLLLSSKEMDNHFRTELLCSRTDGFKNLYPCFFKDCSSSLYSDEHTIFIRSYARLLYEAINCFPLETKMSIEILIQELSRLQSLIDKVIDCKPNKEIARSLLIKSAMKCIIRDSFSCYMTFKNELVVVLDNLPYGSCQPAFDVYKKAALQADQLCEFYDWCKNIGFCGAYEYPFVHRIPVFQIEVLANFLKGVGVGVGQTGQLTTESWLLSSETPSGSTTLSGSTSAEDENMALVTFDDHGEKGGFEKIVEMEPLIQFDDDSLDWEALLDASIKPHWVVSEYLSTSNILHDDNSVNGWEIQLYGHNSVPFDLNSSQQADDSEIDTLRISMQPQISLGSMNLHCSSQ
ncbi:hypothetical protein Leryth_002918 [Lithospermum erythrorhizon]|nr:hypothetical protein Leryth_002918 [Lithospermum erythrorhizon]